MTDFIEAFDAAGSSVGLRTSQSLTALRNSVGQNLAKLLESYGSQRLDALTNAEVNGWTPDDIAAGKQMQATKLKVLRATALNDVAAARESADQLVATVRAEIAKALGQSTPKDTQEALLFELREQRAWNRAKQVLDASASVPEAVGRIAQDAVVADDADTLYALRKELPAYMTSRGFKDSAPLAIQQLDNAVRKASPKMAGALAAAAEVESGWYLLSMAFEHARYAIETEARSVNLTGWDGSVTSVSLGGSVSGR